jgi:hypothetical protein
MPSGFRRGLQTLIATGHVASASRGALDILAAGGESWLRIGGRGDELALAPQAVRLADYAAGHSLVGL